MSEQDPRSRAAVLVAALLAMAFLAGTVVAPLLSSRGEILGPWLHLAYSPTCHQMPERSLKIAGMAQPVCARCEGLYVGGAVGLVAGLVFVVPAGGQRVRRSWLVLAVVPSLIDFVLPWVGLTGVPNVPRFLFALPAGFAAALFLAIGIADLFVRKPVSAPAEVVDG